MLIFNVPKMIFINLPRTGGRSVEISLSPAKRWNDVILGSTQLGEVMQWLYFGDIGLHKHSTAAEIRKVVGESFWQASYRWATIRNPFDVMCSFFGSTAAAIEPLIASESSIPAGASPDEVGQWLESDRYPTGDPWNRPAVRAYLRARGAENPMSVFLRASELEREATMWPQCYRLSGTEGRLDIDEFVKIESLAERWPALLGKIGLPELPLAYANPTPAQYRISRGAAYRDALDVEWMIDRFRADFDAFGYPQNPWIVDVPALPRSQAARARVTPR